MDHSIAHISEFPNQSNQLKGQNDNSFALVCCYAVREYSFDPLKEGGVDSALIGYAQMVTNFPNF